MKKQKKITVKRILSTNICKAVFFNLGTLGVMLLLFYPRFQNTADVIMQNLLYGTIPGLQTSHLVFSNVILGKILLLFSWWFPYIAWYAVFQYLFIFIALTGMSYVILSKFRGALGYIMLVVMLAFLGYEGYITPGYIRTAAILVSAAILLFLYALEYRKKMLCVQSIIAGILGIIGGLYSFKVFLISLGIGLILTVIHLIINKDYRMLIRFAAGAFGVILISGGLFGLDCLKYKDDEYFVHTLEYRDAYEKMISYGINPEYDQDLQENDLFSSEQYAALSQGTFINGDEKALDQIRLVTAQTREFTFDNIRIFFTKIPIGLFSIDVFYLWFIIAVILIVFSKGRARLLIPSVIVLLIGLFFLYMTYALVPNWVYFIILVPAALQLLYNMEPSGKHDYRALGAFLVVASVILYLRFSGTLLTGAVKEGFNALFSDQDLEKPSYLLDLDGYCKSFGAFERFTTHSIPDNVYVVNGFYQTMTYYKPEHYTITNESDSTWLSNPRKYAISNLTATGWRKMNGNRYYYDSGTKVTSWHRVKDKWYYFDRQGVMQTDWVKSAGKWYYLNSDGAMVTGWKEFENRTVYFSPYGEMATGWQNIDQTWYYFDTDGNMLDSVPGVIEEKNDLDQVIRITTVDETGAPVNNYNGYAVDEREYDDKGNIIVQRFMDASGNLVITGSGYAEVHRVYEGRKLIREEYYGIDGSALIQPAGHVAMEQTWDGEQLISRTYLGSNGEPVNRIDGYAKAIWEKDEDYYKVKFYTSTGRSVRNTGLNLARDVKQGVDGWSDWIVPDYDINNSCQNIGSVNLGFKNKGDVYTAQLEIEFRGVTATEGEAFCIRTQGSQDGEWGIGNVWNSKLIKLNEVPEDGVYAYTSTVTVTEDMVNISNFNLGFRCDNWASGMYRVRLVKVEKGDTAGEWSPGP